MFSILAFFQTITQTERGFSEYHFLTTMSNRLRHKGNISFQVFKLVEIYCFCKNRYIFISSMFLQVYLLCKGTSTATGGEMKETNIEFVPGDKFTDSYTKIWASN